MTIADFGLRNADDKDSKIRNPKSAIRNLRL